MIELKNINKIYGKGSSQTLALNDISLSIEMGEFVTIIGKSGCGKSTLLNIIGCMDKSTDGEYLFNGSNVNDFSDRKLANFKNKTIGYVFQSFHLINELSLVENVALPLGYANINKRKRNETAMEMLKLVGLEEHAKKTPTQISGGQRQRVAIARALANNPDIILADEPTGNLDEKNSNDIINLLKEINDRGTTVVMVTHDPQIAAESKRLVRLHDGKLVADSLNV